MKKLSQFLVLIPICLVIVSCTGPAKNPHEFRKGIVEGAAYGKFQNVEVKRPFSKVTQVVEKNAKRCLNKTVVKEGYVNMGRYAQHVPERLTITYRANFVRRGKKAELIVQKDMPGMRKPAGGYYYNIADLEDVGRGKTMLHVYGTTLDNISEKIIDWSKGKNNKCPKLG